MKKFRRCTATIHFFGIQIASCMLGHQCVRRPPCNRELHTKTEKLTQNALVFVFATSHHRAPTGHYGEALPPCSCWGRGHPHVPTATATATSTPIGFEEETSWRPSAKHPSGAPFRPSWRTPVTMLGGASVTSALLPAHGRE